MPLADRKGSGKIGYACYHFPDHSTHPINPETYPWIRKAVWEEHLCAICRQLDFRFLFSHLLSETQLPPPKNDPGRRVTLFDGIRLGPVRDMRTRTDCSFCGLALAALDESHPNGHAPSEIYGQIVECGLINTTRGLRNTSPFQLDAAEDEFPGVIQLRLRLYPKVAMMGDEEQDSYSRDRSSQEPRLVQVVADERGESGKLCPGKYVPRVADFSQMAGWLASCENAARLEGIGEPKSSISTFLIDVKRNCIVGPLRDVPYVALSYVWGNAPQLMCKMDNVVTLCQQLGRTET
jgi:hypothetical protein